MGLERGEQTPLHLVGLRGAQGHQRHLFGRAADIVCNGSRNVLKGEACEVDGVVQLDVNIPTGAI